MPASQWLQQLHLTQKPYVALFFTRPCSFVLGEALRNEKSLVFHFPTSFIYAWSDDNPSKATFEFNYREQFLEMSHDLAYANNVNLQTIPKSVLEDMNKWPEENPDSAKWRKTMILWYQNNISRQEESSGDERSEDENPQEEFWAPGDINFGTDDGDQSEEEDDASHEDSRWK